MARFIFITGGVVSSLGKGLASAALGALLQARGYSVRLRKLDPYLNVDPGTMSVQEQIDHFAAAEVVVAPHGAGLVNLTFAPPGVRVLELFAPRYLNPGYWAIVDNVPDSRYRYVVAEPVDRLRSERAMQGVQDDVDLPADVVLEELEHLLAQDADGQEAPGRTDAGQDGTEHPRSPERGTP